MKNKPIILVVDDVATNRQYLAMLLGETENYEIRLASNGKDAIDYINKEIPDLILLDIMMPEMDGYEVASRLMRNEETRDIPILFTSSSLQLDSLAKRAA